MAVMKIGDVVRATGVPASTIRYYEEIGVLSEPARLNRQRVYEPEVLEHLQAIKIAQDLGFTLQEINVLLGTFRNGKDSSQKCRTMAKQKRRELDELIANAQRMKQILEHGLSCTCTSLQGCYLSEEVTE